MNNNRFKMSFNESGYIKPTNNEINRLINNANIIKPPSNSNNQKPNPNPNPNVYITKFKQTPQPTISVPSAASALNMPMINRVHKAKPGCSACGKKVA